MPTFIEIQSYFMNIYNSFLGFWEMLTQPNLAQMLQDGADAIANNSDTSWIASGILSGLSSIVGLVFGTNASLLNVLLGGALGFFVVWVLLTWLLNIIT